ncbi:2-keto-4-pentenoate hydratase [Falsiroseomonas oryzae]|uniref:2-keto-4-pentenoate hydratase n=1 Tax=Falsiroseomonas oryzae TaxID=2766473 RepID=UPI0022EA3D54|nr:hypothetical protein [Roseomonas sp. MO-31]
MQPAAIAEAARLLAGVQRGEPRLVALPTGAQPATFAEAAAIQVAILAALGESAAGYKVAGVDPDSVMWGAVLGSRAKPSPAVFRAAAVPMLGVEPEIAFRLESEITAADRRVTLAEFDRLVSVVPAIEVVDTRFTSYERTPLLHRAADFMSNGGLVFGAPWIGVAPTELATLGVALHVGGRCVAEVSGGHPAGDPRLPALAFLRAPGRPDRLPRGTIITTGSYAGLHRARPGDRVVASFAGRGELTLSFEA